MAVKEMVPTEPHAYFFWIRDRFTSKGFRLGQTKRDDFMVQCPGHADRTPSLHFTLKLADAQNGDDRIVAQCFGACAGEIEDDRDFWLVRMLKEVDLVPADMFVPLSDEVLVDRLDAALGHRLAATQRDWPVDVKKETGSREPGSMTRGLQTVAAVQTRLGRAGNWLVDRMLAVGDMSVLVAKAGIGKSTFAAQLAVCVAYGRPFLGREVRQGAVIYLAFEGVRSTLAQMVRLGHDPESEVILIHDSEADAKHPAAWLAETVKGHKPALIIIDTLADFARTAPGASNAGYEDMVAKLGAVYQWAQAEGCHVHLLHHGAKGDREGIDTALGTVGIVSKPGTVLDYRPLSKEDGAPRVLKGVKHREGDLEDLPGLVLDFSWEGGLTVAGYREDVQMRELGIALLRVVWDQPGIRQTDAVAAVEGRKQSKLEAVKRLIAADLVSREGQGNSRIAPYRLAIKEGLQGDPVELWKALAIGSRGLIGSRENRSVPTSPEPIEVGETQGESGSESRSVPTIFSSSGTDQLQDDSFTDEASSIGSAVPDYREPEPITASALPVAAPGWCPTCSRFRCVCPTVAVC
jgi:AAA domain